MALLCTLSLGAQRQNNQWRFGFGSALDFNSGRPVELPPCAAASLEGGISVAHSQSGALLFYSNGVRVWDATDTEMPNGAGLLGDTSSAQTGVIIPFPGVSGKYYLFIISSSTLGGAFISTGLSYSVIDMSLNGGRGDIVPGQKNIRLGNTNTGERIQVVPTCDHQGYWVLVHDQPGTSLRSYKVTAAGVDPVPVVSPTGIELSYIGQIKVNRQLNRLVITDDSCARLLDFDNATGRAGNRMDLSPRPGTKSNAYGAEFSPDGHFLYVMFLSTLIQYDMQQTTEAQINASRYVAFQLSGGPIINIGTLQLAPDNRIYGGRDLPVITNPNGARAACGFQRLSGLTGTAGFGLPTWIYDIGDNRITLQDSCAGRGGLLSITDTMQVSSVIWNFGDAASAAGNTGSGTQVTHSFSAPGSYTITATITYACGGSRTLTRTITAVDCCSPTSNAYAAFAYADTVLCSNRGNVLPVPGALFFGGGNFSSGPGLALDAATGAINTATSTPGSYTVRYSTLTPFCPLPLGSTARITVKATPPAPTAASPVSFCVGSPVPAFAVGGQNLLWYDSPRGQALVAVSIDSTTAGTDTLFVTQTIDGCESDPAAIVINAWPLPPVSAGPELHIDYGSQAMLQGSAGAGVQVLWQPGAYAITRPLVSPQATTVYTITGTDSRGCTAADSVHVRVLFELKVPNVFTPNGDGINDTWVIRHLDKYPGLKLEVFDRWGQCVYRWQETPRPWNGDYKGGTLPTGTYYWILSPGAGLPVQSGFVDLIR
jgi:gliding motility-associated-like protein